MCFITFCPIAKNISKYREIVKKLKMTLNLLLVTISTLAFQLTDGKMQGILMNGNSGTQIYDPFNSSHTVGNLQLGLPNRTNARGGAAVNNWQLAYFGSGGAGWWHCDFLTAYQFTFLLINFPDASFFVFNATANTTRTLAPMPKWRSNYGISILYNGVLVCGGNQNGTRVSDCDVLWLFRLYFSFITLAPFSPLNFAIN